MKVYRVSDSRKLSEFLRNFSYWTAAIGILWAGPRNFSYPGSGNQNSVGWSM
jgi:hypothetical protein